MTKIEKVEMAVESILPIIEEYREKADCTMHEYSRGTVSEPIPCSDAEVFLFLEKLVEEYPTAQLTVSHISWEEYGNCAGDELYPVELRATRLPDGRYYLELTGRGIYAEYIFDLDFKEEGQPK